jgi:hypothetical protein
MVLLAWVVVAACLRISSSQTQMGGMNGGMGPHTVPGAGDRVVEGDIRLPLSAVTDLCSARHDCQAPHSCHMPQQPQSCQHFCALQHLVAQNIAEWANRGGGANVRPEDVTIPDMHCDGSSSSGTTAGNNGQSAQNNPGGQVSGSLTLNMDDSALHNAMLGHMCDPASPDFQRFKEAYQRGIAANLPGVTWEQVSIDDNSLIPDGCPTTASNSAPAPPPNGHNLHGDMQHDVGIRVPQAVCDAFAQCGCNSDGTHQGCLCDLSNFDLVPPNTDQSILRGCAQLPSTQCDSFRTHARQQIIGQFATALGVSPATVSVSHTECLDQNEITVSHADNTPLMGTPSGSQSRTSSMTLNLTQDIAMRLCNRSSTAYKAMTLALQQSIADKFSSPGHRVRPEDVTVDLTSYVDLSECHQSGERSCSPLDPGCGTPAPKPSGQPTGMSIWRIVFDAAVVSTVFIACSTLIKNFRSRRRKVGDYARPQMSIIEAEKYGIVNEMDAESGVLGGDQPDGYNSDVDRATYENPVGTARGLDVLSRGGGGGGWGVNRPTDTKRR